MIYRAWKFYSAKLIRTQKLRLHCHAYYFSQFSETTVMEKRIQECKYVKDLMSTLSHERKITSNILHQYCQKYNTLRHRNIETDDLKRIMAFIRKIDLSKTSLQQLSSFAAMFANAWTHNFIDKKLYFVFLKHCRARLQQRSDIETYVLINIYQFFALGEHIGDISLIISKIQSNINKEKLTMRDLHSLFQIISTRFPLCYSEKTLLKNLMAITQKLVNQQSLEVNPEAKLYSTLINISLFELPTSPSSRMLKHLRNQLSNDLKMKIDELTESSIITLFQKLSRSNQIVQIAAEKLFSSINEDGSIRIEPILASNLIKLIANQKNSKKLDNESDKVLKFYQKHLSVCQFQKDILYLIERNFFSNSQLQEIKQLFLKQEIFPNHRQYIYQCLKRQVIFDDYSQFDKFLNSYTLKLSHGSFPTVCVILKWLYDSFPQKQLYKQKLESCKESIRIQLLDEIRILTAWRKLPHHRVQDFLQIFGDIIISQLYKKVESPQQKQQYENYDIMMFLFHGNYLKGVKDSLITVSLANLLLQYVLNEPQKAANRIDFISTVSHKAMGQIKNNLIQRKIKQIKFPKKNKLTTNQYFYLQNKLLKFVAHPQINKHVKPDESYNFVMLIVNFIRDFIEELDTGLTNQFLLGFIVNITHMTINTEAIILLFRQIQQKKSFFKNPNLMINQLLEVKTIGAISPSLASYLLNRIKIQNKNLSFIKAKYLNSISGNITEVDSLPIQAPSLSQIVYIGSRYIEINEQYLEKNSQKIIEQITKIQFTSNISQILLHFQTQNMKSTNTTIYKIFIEILQYLLYIINQSIATKNLYYQKFFFIAKKLKNIELPEQIMKQFFKTLTSHAQITQNASFQNLATYVDLYYLKNIKDPNFIDFVMNKIKKEGIKMHNIVSQHKINIIEFISGHQQIPKTLIQIQISQIIMQNFQKQLINYFKNMLSYQPTPFIINQLKQFLHLQQQNFQIQEADSHYFLVKSNNAVQKQLNRLKKVSYVYAKNQIKAFISFIFKQAQSKKISFDIIQEFNIPVLKIQESYFYFSLNKINKKNKQSEKDYIKTVLGSKITPQEGDQNIKVIFVDQGQLRTTIKQVIQCCPELLLSSVHIDSYLSRINI